MSKPDFVYMIYINSTPEKVWDALTDGKLSRNYWGGRGVESDWGVGAPVLIRRTNTSNTSDAVRGKVLEIDKPRKLVMAWAHQLEDNAPITPASRVTFLIQDAGSDNVKLTVTHEAWEKGSQVDQGVIEGWSAILSSLKTWLETGEPLGVTKKWAEDGR